MFEPSNPDFENNIREKSQRQFFMHLMELKLTSIEAGKISAELAIEQKHLQHKGFVHGGVVATMADVVAGFAAVSLVPDGYHVVTVELKVSYLNPATGSKLSA